MLMLKSTSKLITVGNKYKYRENVLHRPEWEIVIEKKNKYLAFCNLPPLLPVIVVGGLWLLTIKRMSIFTII